MILAIKVKHTAVVGVLKSAREEAESHRLTHSIHVHLYSHMADQSGRII